MSIVFQGNDRQKSQSSQSCGKQKKKTKRTPVAADPTKPIMRVKPKPVTRHGWWDSQPNKKAKKKERPRKNYTCAKDVDPAIVEKLGYFRFEQINSIFKNSLAYFSKNNSENEAYYRAASRTAYGCGFGIIWLHNTTLEAHKRKTRINFVFTNIDDLYEFLSNNNLSFDAQQSSLHIANLMTLVLGKCHSLPLYTYGKYRGTLVLLYHSLSKGQHRCLEQKKNKEAQAESPLAMTSDSTIDR